MAERQSVRRGHYILMGIVLCLWAQDAWADDVGIAEIRLIEEAGNNYALEVDISPYLVDTIQTPMLPERGSFTTAQQRVSLGQMLLIRYRFSTGTSPLGPQDQLLLPWQRTGVVVTAHWLDGESKRVFFNRDLTGIPVAIRSLRSETLTRRAVLLRSVSDAFAYLKDYGWLHLLLIVACAGLGSLRHMMGLMFAFAAGHALSLVASDLGVPSLPPGFVAVMMCVAVILLAAAAYRGTESKRFGLVLLLLGLWQGLDYQAAADAVVARFGFNMVIDVLQITGAGVLGRIVKQIKPETRRVLQYAGGVGAVLALFTVFPAALQPISQEGGGETRFKAVSATGKAPRVASRPVELKDPISGFVTITPFEVRSEWLIRVRDFKHKTPTAPDEFKQALLQRISSAIELTVDRRTIAPTKARADFVNVGTYGVTTRPAVSLEELDTAVVGVSLAYAVEDAPQAVSVSVSFQALDEINTPIPVSVTDPWGSTPHSLTATGATIDWGCRFAGFRRPVILAVKLPSPTWPILSMVLLIVAIVLARLKRRGALVLYVAAVVFYPFIRTPALWTPHGPADADTRAALEQLLTNIYCAFDYQTEDAIYDQLAVSATGDQLTSIYLEHCSAMEIENRGGARASVDEVEVLEVGDVQSSPEGLSAHASWSVSGSVSHFGHTHYRTNRYQAQVKLTLMQGVWKISGLQVKEKERVL